MYLPCQSVFSTGWDIVNILRLLSPLNTYHVLPRKRKDFSYPKLNILPVMQEWDFTVNNTYIGENCDHWYDTTTCKYQWFWSEVWLVYRLLQKSWVLMNINEYSNELICIYEYHIKWQSLSSYLVPVLSICVEHRLRYTLCTMLAVEYQYISYVAMETVRSLHIPNEIFLRNNFILIKLHSVTNLAPINILLWYRVGLGSSQLITVSYFNILSFNIT